MFDLAPYLPGFIAAYAILLVGASSPGPSVALLIGIATDQGRAPALMATLGISLASVTLNTLTLLGVGLLISQAAWAMTGLRFLGALYLLYLAYGAFRKAVHPPVLRPMAAERKPMWRQFMAGYLLQVSNPKAIAFWLAIASVGAVAGAPLAVVVLFVLGAAVISFLCHGAWAVAMSAGPVRAIYARGRRWIEASLGVLFVFFAWKLATSER